MKQLEEEKSVFKETINAQFETMYFSIANCLSNFAVSGHNIRDYSVAIVWIPTSLAVSSAQRK